MALRNEILHVHNAFMYDQFIVGLSVFVGFVEHEGNVEYHHP